MLKEIYYGQPAQPPTTLPKRSRGHLLPCGIGKFISEGALLSLKNLVGALLCWPHVMMRDTPIERGSLSPLGMVRLKKSRGQAVALSC